MPDTGSELVEFAFAVSMLMTLILGIVVFARAYNIYQTVTRATREGVREAVLPTAVASGNNLSFIGSDGVCSSKTATTNTPSTPIFTNFIAPALQASSLNPANVQNYSECVGYLDPSTTATTTDPDTQCGVQVSFQYPVHLIIPFVAGNLTGFNVSTRVQMRLEDQTASSGSLVCAAGG